MPSELLHFPPLYSIVGAYRLATDSSIRTPVLDKIRHATVRGLIVGIIYTSLGWKTLEWFTQRWVIGRARMGSGERVTVGIGLFSLNLDLVLYTHLLILVPQIGAILRFFIIKNIRIARSRAYALTVASRGKPKEFWSQGYIEEWAKPPSLSEAQRRVGSGARRHREQWVSWVLWWPTQLILKHYILLPLSPTLPLLVPFATSALRALEAASYLHEPYFEVKRMSPDEVWRWVEERKWAYRVFGFTSSLLESIPILGLFLSISNRIGAAMWAHDLEKRQHLFAHGVLRPLQPFQIGLFGEGMTLDRSIDIRSAQAEIERELQAGKVPREQ